MSTTASYRLDKHDDKVKRTLDSVIGSPPFRHAELRAEHARVVALLGVLGSLLALVLVRAVTSAAHGRRSEAWPFALLLTVMSGYEAVWLVCIRRAILKRWKVSREWWRNSVVLEALLPTAALILQIQTRFMGPAQSLTSPVVLAYFFLILLSILHLDPGLSRLAGAASAVGYAAASAIAFLDFPGAFATGVELAYAKSLSCAICLLAGGFVAGAVASQIRDRVAAAINSAEGRAKVAQTDRGFHVARSIQQDLLPESFPPLEGFDIAGWNQPAEETGGDYFDCQQLGNGRIAVTVADVTGHGTGTVLSIATCRAYVRATLATEPDLRIALGRLNRFLYADLSPEKFVTLAVALLTPHEATMELISAGHGPLLFYLSAEKRFRSYDAQGVPLGLLPDPNYLPRQLLTFDPGDIFALVTDGLLEWANPQGEEFGQQRLKEVIKANSQRPAKAIVAALHAALLEFTQSTPQNDDLTVVVLKREPALA